VAALSPLNRALNQIPRRAERQESPQLHETFVDSGVADVLDMQDHQILYGRRGTGKTHAFGYLASEATSRGDMALNIDLRTVGSPDGVLNSSSASAIDRASRLLVDLLGQLRDALLEAVLADEALVEDDRFVTRVDDLLAAITNVRIVGDVEVSTEAEHKGSAASGTSLGISTNPMPVLSVELSERTSSEGREFLRERRRGEEHISINFSDVARTLRDLAATLTTKRIWLLLDEWSSVPVDLQPYLAEFLVRCIIPLQRFTLKIAAIEQQTNFRTVVDANTIGLELGADVGAHVDLDDFMVYEGNEDQAREFFRGLFYKHLTSGVDVTAVSGLNDPFDFVRLGFTDSRAFDELVRAAEGVPRDALYIAARAAMRAGGNPISVPLVRDAARNWYQTDKSRALEGIPEAQRLLQWIVDRVIREKRARAFLVNEDHARDALLLALFDARVLHVVRRGYSAQDQPGERYDVWLIDYGAYVDLLQTKYAPEGFLPFEADAGDRDDLESAYADVDVPSQDLRAIRRAILNLDEFYQSIH
jgi:hypothetical protein